MIEKLTINISPEPQTYDIHFLEEKNDLITKLKSLINKRNYLIVTDENTFHKSTLFQENHFPPDKILTLPAGEAHKHWPTVETILETGFAQNLDRHSVFIAIGGGVIGDMVGFAAALFMRGTPVIQVPTTLLAMVDASVGGKTAIDCQFGKNLIGAFNQPEAILCGKFFLETLPNTEIQNGLAEMVKHGIISSEKHFADLENLAKKYQETKTWNLDDIFKLVPNSIEIKQEIIEQDVTETGIRGYLNLGHTFGHAIELLSKYQIPHGRAVAIGCVMASHFALEKEWCDEETTDRIENLFHQFDIDTTCEFAMEDIFAAMSHDKKKRGNTIRLILPKQIGEVNYFEMEIV